MKLSIIISTYNCDEAFDLCMSSVSDQYCKNIEVVIADDGSSNPESLARLLFWEKNLGLEYKIANQVDKGFRLARSRNNAVQYSSGDILLFLDHDIILPRNFCEVLLDCMVPKWFVAGRRLKLDNKISEELKNRERTVASLNSVQFKMYAMSNRMPGWRYILPFLRDRRPGLTDQPYQGMSGFCIAAYREDFLAVNGFDNSYVGYGIEDWDLLVRLKHYGCKGGYLPGRATVYHLWHKECGQCSPKNHERHNNVVNNRIIWAVDGYINLK